MIALQLLCLPFAVFALSVPAQANDDPRPNDPTLCPWCEGDPELMAQSGVLSHGGFAFGLSDTKGVDEYLATSDIKWVETPNFQLGYALAPYKVRMEERHKLRGELTELSEVFPDIKPKAKTLDPWLMAHLYARRVEAQLERFLEIAQVEMKDFPDGKTGWDMTSPYMGEGPHLGMKDKFEILILPSEPACRDYLGKQFGIRHPLTQRWHLPAEQTLSITTHTQQAQLRVDAALHGHIAFNLTHNFLNGYKHYSYETPVWLHEGLAHVMERELDPAYNSFDSSEGAVATKTRKERWGPEVLSLIASDKAPRLSQLISLKTYGELNLPTHYVTWSMVDYLLREHPDDLAALIGGLKGLKREDGWPDGGRVKDRQRELFRELFGGSYADFDRAWREWAQAAY